jgi:hypothetical protein
MHMGDKGVTTMVERRNDGSDGSDGSDGASDDDATKPLPEQPHPEQQDAAGDAPTEPIGSAAGDPDAPTRLLGTQSPGAPIDVQGDTLPTERIAAHVPIADLGATGATPVPGPGAGDSTSVGSRKPVAPWILGGLAAVLIVALAIIILPGLLNGSPLSGPSVSPSPSQSQPPSTEPSEAPVAVPTLEAPSASPEAPDPGEGGDDDSAPEPTQNPPAVPTTDPIPEPTVSVGP